MIRALNLLVVVPSITAAGVAAAASAPAQPPPPNPGPCTFTLSAPLGLTPTAIVLTTCIGTGLAFTLPISSAPNTIAFASGYVRMRDMLVVGSVMTAAQLTILLLVAWLYWPGTWAAACAVFAAITLPPRP